ncbi:MAG: hypothetical protein CVV27_06935, partial [Candidatus Melainabacteria bacterium HGW-Melainabacteria-1]
MSFAEAQVLCRQADDCLLKATQVQENGVLLAEATSLFLKATDLDPLTATPYLGLASILYSMGDQQRSVGLLMQAQELEPFNLDVVQRLRRFQKTPPPAPPQNSLSQQISSLNPAAFAETVSFGAEPVPAPRQISALIGLKPSCVQSGPQVELLQSALLALGYAIDMNGQFDKACHQALQAYQ